jgi:HEAT repeat protein
MAAGTAGILLAMGLVWFASAMAVSAWRLRGDIALCHDTMTGYPHIWPEKLARESVERLGSPRRAVLCLRLYCLLPESMAPHREDAMTLLQYCGRPAVPVLLRYLGDQNGQVRGHAAESLGALRAPETIDRIAPMLKDPDRFVRESAAIALGEIGEAAAIPFLAEAMDDNEERVRGYVVRALGDIGGPDTLPLLIQATQDKDDYVRWIAAKGLGSSADERAVEPLCRLLGDTKSSVREEAAKAIGEIGPAARSCVPALNGLANDESTYVRSTAAEALAKIRGADGNAE